MQHHALPLWPLWSYTERLRQSWCMLVDKDGEVVISGAVWCLFPPTKTPASRKTCITTPCHAPTPRRTIHSCKSFVTVAPLIIVVVSNSIYQLVCWILYIPRVCLIHKNIICGYLLWMMMICLDPWYLQSSIYTLQPDLINGLDLVIACFVSVILGTRMGCWDIATHTTWPTCDEKRNCIISTHICFCLDLFSN